MTLKDIKKETVGIFVLGVVVIIIVIIARIDWLGYKAADTAKSKRMMAYLNLKQVVFDLPADEDELSEFVEDVGFEDKGSGLESGILKWNLDTLNTHHLI